MLRHKAKAPQSAIADGAFSIRSLALGTFYIHCSEWEKSKVCTQLTKYSEVAHYLLNSPKYGCYPDRFYHTSKNKEQKNNFRQLVKYLYFIPYSTSLQCALFLAMHHCDVCHFFSNASLRCVPFFLQCIVAMHALFFYNASL